MKLVIRSLFLAATTVALTGCPAAQQALMQAALPSGAPSAAPSAGASAAPAAAASTSPSTAPAATTKPSTAPVQATDPEDCKATKDDSEKDNGVAAQGGYENQYMPKGWVAVHKTEKAVTDAIAKIDGTADWACFQKFYPGATTIYKRRTGQEE